MCECDLTSSPSSSSVWFRVFFGHRPGTTSGKSAGCCASRAVSCGLLLGCSDIVCEIIHLLRGRGTLLSRLGWLGTSCSSVPSLGLWLAPFPGVRPPDAFRDAPFLNVIIVPLLGERACPGQFTWPVFYPLTGYWAGRVFQAEGLVRAAVVWAQGVMASSPASALLSEATLGLRCGGGTAVGLCVFMCVFVHASMGVCLCVQAWACVCACVHMNLCMYVWYMRLCVFVCARASVHVSVCGTCV